MGLFSIKNKITKTCIAHDAKFPCCGLLAVFSKTDASMQIISQTNRDNIYSFQNKKSCHERLWYQKYDTYKYKTSNNIPRKEIWKQTTLPVSWQNYFSCRILYWILSFEWFTHIFTDICYDMSVHLGHQSWLESINDRLTNLYNKAGLIQHSPYNKRSATWVSYHDITKHFTIC